jgi:hypothetical protein
MSIPSPVPKSMSKSLHINAPPFNSPSSILFCSLLFAAFFKIKYQIPPQQQPCAIIHQTSVSHDKTTQLFLLSVLCPLISAFLLFVFFSIRGTNIIFWITGMRVFFECAPPFRHNSSCRVFTILTSLQLPPFTGRQAGLFFQSLVINHPLNDFHLSAIQYLTMIVQ